MKKQLIRPNKIYIEKICRSIIRLLTKIHFDE